MPTVMLFTALLPVMVARIGYEIGYEIGYVLKNAMV
jgi:hypothetical protein